jgi:hypothetical protein
VVTDNGTCIPNPCYIAESQVVALTQKTVIRVLQLGQVLCLGTSTVHKEIHSKFHSNRPSHSKVIRTGRTNMKDSHTSLSTL